MWAPGAPAEPGQLAGVTPYTGDWPSYTCLKNFVMNISGLALSQFYSSSTCFAGMSLGMSPTVL